MEQHDQQRIRQALEGALKKLKEGTFEGAASSDSSVLFADRVPSSEAPEAGAPLVLVVLAGGNSPLQVGMTSTAQSDNASKTPLLQHCGTEHPGLERFAISEIDPHPTAPKPCFMEPARTCVNSGACEMRGF